MNKRLKAMFLVDGQSFEIDVLSANIEVLDRGDITNITEYGIYSNQGQLGFVDTNNLFYNIIDGDTSSPPSFPVYLYLGENATTANRIGKYNISSIAYDKETSHCTLTLIDELIGWQDILVPEIYPFETRTAMNILQLIFSEAELPATVITQIKFSEEARNRLNAINIYCPRITKTTLWDAVNKICEISLCRVIIIGGYIHVVAGDSLRNLESTPDIRPNNIVNFEPGNLSYSPKIPSTEIVSTNRAKRDGNSADYELNFTAYNEISSNNEAFSFVGENCEITETYGERRAITISGEIDPPESLKSFEQSLRLRFRRGSCVNGVRTWSTIDTSTNSYAPTETEVSLADGKLNVKAVYYSGATIASENNGSAILNGIVRPNLQYYIDHSDIVYSYNINETTTQPFILTSNDLVQELNTITYANSTFSDTHAEWILKNISSIAGNTRTCAEIECLFSDYFDANGELVLQGDWNNTVRSFTLYDIVRVFIKQNGRTTSVGGYDDNGNPKKYSIIGIKYLFNGMLTQRLLLQEIAE